MTVGNLTLSLVPEKVEVDEELDAMLVKMESDDVDPEKEHNYYQVRTGVFGAGRGVGLARRSHTCS